LTRAIVGGAGEQEERLFFEGTLAQSTEAETLWGRRIESFVDARSTQETAEFEQEAQMSMDDYESRQGSGKGVTEGKYKLDESGRSAAGKAKMAQQDKSVRAAVVEEPSVFTKMVQRVREWKLH
jgi:hypothetical protein